MRFGEILLSKQNPEWASSYLNYNSLKAQLNKLVSQKKASTEHLPQLAAASDHSDLDAFQTFINLLNQVTAVFVLLI